MADSKSDFICLKNVDSSFQNRSNSIFGRLGSLECSYDNCRTNTKDETVTEEKSCPGRKMFSGGSDRRCRLPARVPDHVLSPEKWTKYSLRMDGSEGYRGMNEHALNTHAAYSFLADLKRRKSRENVRQSPESPDEVGKPSSETKNFDHTDAKGQTSNSDPKLLFKQPDPKIDMTSSNSNMEGVWRSGTYTMPEYVVGACKPKCTRKHSNTNLGTTNDLVTLGHLANELADSAEANDADLGKIEKAKGKRNFRKRKVDEDTC